MGASNIMRLVGEGLKDGQAFDLGSSDALKILPEVDDTGKLQVGDGTTDMDVVVYLGDSSTKVTFDVGSTQLALAGVDISSNSAIVTTGAVNSATIKTTGDINAASITCVGAVNTASVAATGNSNAATFTATTAVNTVDVNFTGEITPSANAFFSTKAKTTQATDTLAANASHFDSIIQITQANATTVTLPAPAAGNLGARVIVACLTNAAHVVACANTIIGLGSIVGDTATAAETDKTGQTITLISDASKWVVVACTGTWTIAAA